MICKWLSHHVHIGASGEYRLCCTSAEPKNNETVFTHTPEEWLSSEIVSSTKKILEQGAWPDSCITCKEHEQRGQKSNRQSKSIHGPGISNLDLRFGNSCNLKCISCYGGASSSIALENAEMVAQKIIPVAYHTGYLNWYDEKFLTYFDNLPLKEVYLTGGEPMMVRHLPKFLERLDPSITIRFNTNGTIFNPNINSILKKFKTVIMSVSLDAIGDRLSYIRYGSIWKTIEQNTLEYSQMFHTDLTPSISVLNVLYYGEILEWANKHHLKIFDNVIVTPRWLNLQNAPNMLKQQFAYFKNWANTDHDPLQIELFKTEIKRLDHFRKMHIKDYLPEVAEAYWSER